jgi:2-deoxy-D-gluconate 3-dehydrogenase
VSDSLFDLKGKVAVVTGADKGLGQAMAVGLSQAGAKVAGVARRSCDETCRLIEEKGGEFFGIQADISKTESTEYIVEAVLKKFGRVDILVNNAGITRRDEALDLSCEDWSDVIQINQNAAFFLSQAFAREFVRQNEGGRIINICSIRSFQGGSGVAAYTASKTALMGITKALATEWGKYGINVNAIAPGFMKTDITETLRSDKKRSDEIVAGIPAGRWGTPDDLKGTVVYLASRASDYVNGHVLVVDGGWLAK